MERANQQLQDAYRALELTSRQDGLTGVANRGCFDRWLEQAMDDAVVRAKPIALLMIDVDHFKAYNDSHGHLAGDACLREVASVLAYLLDATPARLARYGGEEFVVIVPDSDGPSAQAIAERLRLSVEVRGIEHRQGEGNVVTVSVGAAIRTCRPGDRPDDLIQSADAALYEAKRAGRNRVCVAG